MIISEILENFKVYVFFKNQNKNGSYNSKQASNEEYLQVTSYLK